MQQKEEIQAQNEAIEKQQKDIVEKNEELNQSNEELTSSLELINAQKDELEQVHRQIQDSIRYARRIQEAVLPTPQALAQNFSQHFVFFRPRNIVSGDFYWCQQIREYAVVAAADCTGHGVPGAFMSMLGISFLNEIIRKEDVVRAGHVLDLLRAYIKSTLQQTGKSGEQQDGMDISLCIINTKTRVLDFAGAHNSLCVVNRKTIQEQRTAEHPDYLSEYIQLENAPDRNPLALLEVKADRQPIGVYPKEKPFQSYELPLMHGDTFYLFSDGFADQIGGPRQRKFMLRAFKKLLLSVSHQPMSVQVQTLETTLHDWMGDENQQVDDILVLGFRVD